MVESPRIHLTSAGSFSELRHFKPSREVGLLLVLNKPPARPHWVGAPGIMSLNRPVDGALVQRAMVWTEPAAHASTVQGPLTVERGRPGSGPQDAEIDVLMLRTGTEALFPGEEKVTLPQSVTPVPPRTWCPELPPWLPGVSKTLRRTTGG